MGDPVIRAFRESDTPGAASALVEVHAADGYPVEGVSRPETWIRPHGVIASWVAEIDGRIVGHVAVMRPDGEDAVALWTTRSGGGEATIAVLARLFVRPAARNRTVGEHLTRAAMTYAQQNNMRLVLDVMTKDTTAIRLYERLGWQKTGDATHHFGDGQHTGALCYVSPPHGAPRPE